MLSTKLMSITPGLKWSLFRPLHTSFTLNAAEKSPLYQLRQKTGLAYNLCREALNKHNNDVKEAEAWLKAQAIALGLQKATKVRDRSAKEGLICLATGGQNKEVSILQLNCETDFVAKNQIFKDFAIDLTEQFAASRQDCDVVKVPDHRSINVLKPKEAHLKSLDKQIVPFISKLGENIRIQKAQHFQVLEENLQIFGQVHAKAGQKRTGELDILTGRFGAIVALKLLNAVKNSHITPIGNRLCQHVIGYNPTYIELPDNIRKHLEDAEKQRLETEKNKEVGVREEGEFTDSEDSHIEHNSQDDWPSIMDQSLIMSDSMTVRHFCKENEISIIYFNRFECGDTP